MQSKIFYSCGYEGISTLLKKIGSLGSRRNVKVSYVDLDSFILIFHFQHFNTHVNNLPHLTAAARYKSCVTYNQ